jgi:hypothetical protein
MQLRTTAGLSAVLIFRDSSARTEDEPACRQAGKVNTVEIIFCRSALFVQPGLQPISERDDQYIFLSQHSRKPHVVGSRLFLRNYRRKIILIIELLVVASLPSFIRYLSN